MDARVARCMLVAKVLVADGLLPDAEKHFLREAMDQEGLSDEERALVDRLEGWADAERLLAAEPEADKRAFMDRLASAVLVDGHISPHERGAVEAIAKALGLS